MTKASNKRGRPGYERSQVLRLCVEAFNEYGYEATSMDMLAKRLGLSKSAIYHHVSSKEEILESALQQALGGLEEVFEAGEMLDAPAVEGVEFVVRQTVYVLAEQLPQVTLLLRLKGNTPVQVQALERRRQLTTRLAALVAAAQAQGDVRGDIDSRTQARLVFGLINSLAVWYRPKDHQGLEELADAVVAMAFKGISV